MGEKKQFPFVMRGVDLNSAPDQLQPGFVQSIENFRRDTDNSITPRQGLGTGSPVMSGQTPAHSVRRLSDSSTGTTSSALVIGAGTHLGICLSDLSTTTSAESGFSGDPLSICIHRPAQSTKPFAYVADRLKLRKIDASGADKQIGLPHPSSPPSATLAQPNYKVLDEFNDHTLWAVSGTAGGKANHTRIDGATRSVTAVLFDSGTTGWACVRPNSMENIGAGMRITVGGETATVQEVHRGSAATTIAGILYVAGSGTGVCSIHLTTPLEDIEVNSMVQINGTEYVRVLSVHRSHDGGMSFRCFTTGAYLGGESVQAFSSFRAYFTAGKAAGNAISASGVEFTVTAGTANITRTVALDLSSIAAGVATRPEDFMHLDLYTDDPSAISEVKLYMDIDATSSNFTRNYLLYVISANDLTPLTKDEQTLIDYRRVKEQRDILAQTLVKPGLGARGDAPEIDPPGPSKEEDLETRQFNAGQNQWSSMKFRISQLLNQEEGRVGADQSRGLKDVAALKISVIASGSATVRVDGWWIGGGFGPDVTVAGRERTYRYRGLDSSTGAVSNWSPALMGGVLPLRQKVNVSFTAHPSLECDKLEVQVYGGDRLGWCYAETIDNTAFPFPSMDDVFSDEELQLRRAASEQSNNHYQLWPQIRPPVSGAGVNMAGNLVSVLGFGSIDANTAPGTNILIGNRNFTIRQVLSTTKFYTEESGGALFAAAWTIPEPLVTGQPLPILCGPLFGFFFGLKDKYNPWRCYYTNGYDADSTRDTHYFDVESQTLENMVVLEEMGRAVLLSTDGAFLVEPTFTLAQSGGNLFAARRIADAPGLFATWACCAADGEVAYLSKDGIYTTNGSGTRYISHDLRPIFPRGASLGTTVRGVVAPNMTAANLTKFRLSYSGRHLRFDYIGIDGNYHTLTNEKGPEDNWLGWLPSTYGVSVLLHYDEEGEGINGTIACGLDGKFYRLGSGQGDAGGTFTASVTTVDHHFGDARVIKHMMESVVDCDRDGATVTAVLGLNHRSTTPDTLTINTGAGRTQYIFDFDSGRGRDAKDVSLAISSVVSTQRPKLYLYEISYSMRFDSSLLRAEDFQMKQQGSLWVRGVYIYADTQGLDRDALLEFTDDFGSVGSVIIQNISHSELSERYYPLSSPQYMSATRVRPTDADSWEFAGYRLEGEPAPPLSDGPTQKILDGMQARYVQGVKFDIDTGNDAINMAVRVDEGVLQTTISAGANKGPVQSDGRAVKHYTFDVPFITHIIEFDPSAPCRIWGIEVISEPEPEMAYMWWAQQTDLGVGGYKVLGDGFVTVRSTSSIVIELIADGVSYFPAFFDVSTNTASARRTLRFRCPPMKFKSLQAKVYASTSLGRVAVYQKEFQLEFKPFSFEGSWQKANLLGDVHYVSGARI